MKRLRGEPLLLILFCSTLGAGTSWNELTPPERVFCFYIFRASLPGNEILVDQHHRHAGIIAAILETILLRREMIQYADDTISDTFFEQLRTYLEAFWTNHSQYVADQAGNNKFTPAALGLDELSPARVQQALRLLGDERAEEHVSLIYRAMFDASYEPALVTPGSIAHSAINFYAPGFTNDDYEKLTLAERDKLTAYNTVEYDFRGKQVGIKPYGLVGYYAEPFTVALCWLTKAHQHVLKYPELFDSSLAKSLELLCAYIVTGNETYLLEAQSKAADSTSRVQYTWGFVETDKDPMGTKGFYRAGLSIGQETLLYLGEGYVRPFVVSDFCEAKIVSNPYERSPVTLYPIIESVADSETQEITDATSRMPRDLVEQHLYWTRHSLSLT